MTSLALVPALAMMLAQTSGDARAFFGGQVASEFEADWFAKALSRMDEPSLATATSSARSFRCTVLPTWGHPVSVRLSLSGSSGTLEAKRLSGLGGYELGRLEEKGSVPIDAAQVEEFVGLFAKLGFRQMPFQDPVLGADGSEWILEAAEQGEYHVVARWTPKAYNTEKRGLRAFVEACEWLYRASPFEDDVRNGRRIEISKRSR
jgi:hypothetical protein